MSFNLSYNISEGSDCKSVTLCDTTCLINHYDKYTCCDGYGVEGNISREDISYTRFNWKMPNGAQYLGINLYWQPGTRAKGSFQVTGGTTGVIVAAIDSVVIGQAIFITDIATTVALLIQSINSIASQTGWQAYLAPSTTDTVIVENINLGIEYNLKPVNVSISGDITVLLITDPTTGANGYNDCICFGLKEIYELSNDCPPTEFPDGVHEITYILYDINNQEIGRSKKNVLFTCLLKCIIRRLTLLTAEDKCSCSDKFDERLVELRLMLEKAEIQMDDCLYDCANETMILAHKMADGICLDC
jgi:hypothetical protein